jgi:hypothetical protein
MWADGPAGRLGFGQEAAYEPGWRLGITLPRDADVTILRDGAAVASREKTSTMELAIEAPGVYRAEVRLEGRPWIFGNPIYLRES